MNPSRNSATSSDEQPPVGETISTSLSNFTSDLSTLVDLQTELLKIELRQWLAQAAGRAVIVGVSLILALAATPLLLASLALWLQDAAKLSLAAALAMVGGGAIVVAGALGAFAVNRLRGEAAPFPRFRRELHNNIHWLGQIVGRQRPGAAPAPRS